MVLFKRKAVEFVAPPALPEDFDWDTPVWYIAETGEWFLDYEQYLDRMSYYNIKKFVCETSGNSNFTYFEALKVEKNELQLMESKFPDPVKEPILRHVSFSTFPRIDVMVDDVYNSFKEDFFPGDQVIVRGIHEKMRGVVREKARFNPIQLPDGTLREGYCSYRVLLETNEEVAVNDASRMSRERNTFTKWFVKSFLKMSLTRVNRAGAPWVVREPIAKKYKIPMEYPAELRHFEEEERPKDEYDGRGIPTSRETSMLFSLNPGNLFEDIKETPPNASEHDEGKNLRDWKDRWYEVLKRATVYYGPIPAGETVDGDLQEKVRSMFQFAGAQQVDTFDAKTVNFYISTRVFSSRVHYEPDDDFAQIHAAKIKVWHYEKCLRFFKSINITPRKIEQARKMAQMPGVVIADVKRQIIANRNFAFQTEQQDDTGNSTPVHSHVSNTAAPHPRGPRGFSGTDDLEIPFRQEAARPNWHRLDASLGDPSILLEVWLFMNMYHGALVIDNFTFDDFCAALKWTDQEQECQLLLEIFCSLLSAILDQSGQMQVSLPEELMETDKEEEGGEDEKGEKKEGGEDEEDEITHNAYAVIEFRKVKWQERLKKRRFKSGGWLCILLGVFSMIDYTPEYMDTINQIYCTLAPEDIKPTPATVEERFYTELTPDLRVKGLQILVNLLLNGTVVREYMDKVAEEAANYRRERYELIRQVKAVSDEAREIQTQVIESLDQLDTAEIELQLRDSSKDANGRGRGRGGRPSPNYLPPEPTELEKAVGLAHPEFLELIKRRGDKIKELEEHKARRKEIDRHLTELSIQRLRYMGKDRMYNRYWWFERNGLPNLGSSVRDDEDEEDGEKEEEVEEEVEDDEDDQYVTETYLMGRLWMQGPTDFDRRAHLKLSDEQLKKYEDGEEKVADVEGNIALHRKVLEEGPDALLETADWRYLETPEEFQTLIEWLNTAGFREKTLKKEAVELQESIKRSLKSRRAFLEKEDDKEEEEGEEEKEQEEEEDGETDASIGSEKKRAAEGSAQSSPKRVKREEDEKLAETEAETEEEKAAKAEQKEQEVLLLWVNSSALETLGHTHYEGEPEVVPKKRGRRKKGRK